MNTRTNEAVWIPSIVSISANKGGAIRAVQSDSWENPETLSWSLWLTKGIETLRVVFTNDFYDGVTGR